MDEEITKEEIQACPTCGSAVVIRGHVTRYYLPVSQSKLKKLGMNVQSIEAQQLAKEKTV